MVICYPSVAIAGTYLIWGAQLELGYGANQYVPTTTTSATASAQTSATLAAQTSASRAPDVMLLSSGISASGVAGIVAQGSFNGYSNFLLQNFATLTDGTTSNVINLGAYTNTGLSLAGSFAAQITIAGSIVKNLYQGGAISNATQFRKLGLSFGNNSLVVSENGSGVSDAGLGNGSFSGSLSFNQLEIGYALNSSTQQMNGYLQKLKLYPSSMSQNQLNTLTALSFPT